MTGQPLVRARGLRVSFISREATVTAVNGIDLDLDEGEVLCILGESGSGKSVTLRALLRLNPKGKTVMTGALAVAGHDIMTIPDGRLSAVRGKVVSMIFQEPMTALDPVFTIGYQIAETLIRHEGISRREADRRALELLELVQIPSARRRLGAYPHELSGGLRQRAMIAMAISCRPKLLLADEPTTALDATVQIQILLLLRSLQQELGMGVIFVTHDLGVAGEIADRIAVMYAGRIVELGSTVDVMRQPFHPYTQGLMGATVHSGTRGKRLTTIPGAPPDLRFPFEGCAFAPRCSHASDACRESMPAFRHPGPGRAVRCIRVEDAEIKHSPKRVSAMA
ncbi:ABC transporter ATP-binding protein [Propylenella binzhouense]|uniref:ABC transporter ATP-binding protein n=1 Tax=Propylenella binzhouense TaxID=2555902 RepID=A0A964WU30_9HYPH|nr:ABC transporter ATP-binding protein [Propylenella binzhouense]MYZ48621.1 ABC transporter ATP-binding protein [Propylenella binzhouense]